MVANAPLSLAAVNQAIYQVRNRIDPLTSGRTERKVDVSRFVLLVPKGSADIARYVLFGSTVIQTQVVNGTTTTVSAPTATGRALFDLTPSIASIVESDYLTGSQWALIPAKGASKYRYASFNTLAAAPGLELRVAGASFAGTRIAGSSLDAGVLQAASFDTDTAAIRAKAYHTAVSEHPELGVWSTGAGV